MMLLLGALIEGIMVHIVVKIAVWCSGLRVGTQI